MERDPSDGTRALNRIEARGTGALVFAVVMASGSAIYAWTILRTARNPGDWLLIVPAAGIGIAALAWALVDDARRFIRTDTQLVARVRERATQPVMLLVLIAVYGMTLPIAGFDVGTFMFLVLALLIQGERRLWLIVLNAIFGTALMVWVFHGLLMVRLPLLLF